MPFILVGTKRDLRSNPIVLQQLVSRGVMPISYESASEVARNVYASVYLEISALTDDHIQDLFAHVVKVATTGRAGNPISKLLNQRSAQEKVTAIQMPCVALMCSNGMACEDVTCYDLAERSWMPVCPFLIRLIIKAMFTKVPIKPTIRAPRARFRHTAICHNKTMIIFDLLCMEWLKPVTKGITPPPMRGHSAAVIGDEMFVCSCVPTAKSMVLLRLTLGSYEWSRIDIANSPPVREFHTLLSSGTGSLILAGGRALTPSGLPTGKMQGDAWWLQLYSNVFGMLPHELWMNIFSYCDRKSLFRLSAVCREFRTLASTDALWVPYVSTSIIKSHTRAPLKSLFRFTVSFHVYTAGATAGDWYLDPSPPASPTSCLEP
ncbi:hypothetical protein Pelo_17100 [Pelomyxa schiedti]|nr:hypothetical protein Pelo_17100 [Pelomyxa schiedti]